MQGIFSFGAYPITDPRILARYSGLPDTWEFEMKALQKAVEVSFKRRGTSLPENIPFALTGGFLDDPKRKCNGTRSSTAWIPARRGQLSQRSVRLFAVFFCRPFQKNHCGIQARAGIQPLIGIEKGWASPVLVQISESRSGLPMVVSLTIDPLQICGVCYCRVPGS